MKPLLTYFKQLSTLQWALSISVCLHALLLTLRFVNPEGFNRVFQDTPLEVILVNAKSDERPEKAQAVAQTSLAGGGVAQEGRATSPLPSDIDTVVGDAPENQDEQRLMELKAQQDQILALVRKQLATMPPPDLQAVNPSNDSIERERKRQAMINTIAEIEKRIASENARPRKRVISPATREEVYAVYYDELRRKIEERGTSNFPESGGNKLYGELTMMITVNHTGAVLDTEIKLASGSPTLDRRAQAIVKGLNFGNFNDDMRRQADQLIVVSRFRFTRETGLQTMIDGR